MALVVDKMRVENIGHDDLARLDPDYVEYQIDPITKKSKPTYPNQKLIRDKLREMYHSLSKKEKDKYQSSFMNLVKKLMPDRDSSIDPNTSWDEVQSDTEKHYMMCDEL